MRILATALRLAAALAVAGLALAPTHAAAAVIADIDAGARTTLVVHAFEQPQDLGDRATGLPLDLPALDQLDPLEGVEFSATLVPGIDLTSAAGWTSARALTTGQAARLVADEPVSARAVSGQDGTARLSPLRVGLYYVEETAAPAGVVAAAPFLVALPMAHPVDDGWLYTVHAYPKSATVGVELEVNEAVTCSAEVSWTSHSRVPRAEDIDGYTLRNLLPRGARLVGAPSDAVVALAAAGTPALAPTDYAVRTRTVDGRVALEVTFSDAGRAKLAAARAADPDATVAVTYRTALSGLGVHQADAVLLVDGAGPVTGIAATSLVDCPDPTPTPTRTPSPTPVPSPSPSPKPGGGLPDTGAAFGSGAALVVVALVVGLLIVQRVAQRGPGLE
ncbi:MAG: SpaH/EbpB family LPXTG-anchored major pilin [Arachnia sp.]